MTHWITYSEPSASRLAALLSTMGHQALCEPVTQIDRLLLAEAMPDARPDLIIALSQHAVSAYLENYNKPTHAGALVLAIGPATAAGLIEHGGLRVRVSDPANSEGLLAMSDIAALQRHQTVWLLTGEGGRGHPHRSEAIPSGAAAMPQYPTWPTGLLSSPDQRRGPLGHRAQSIRPPSLGQWQEPEPRHVSACCNSLNRPKPRAETAR